MDRLIIPLRDEISFADTRAMHRKFGRRFPVMRVRFRFHQSKNGLVTAGYSSPSDAIIDTGTEETLISGKTAKKIRMPEHGVHHFKWFDVLGEKHPSRAYRVLAYPINPNTGVDQFPVPVWIRVLEGCTRHLLLIGRDFFVEDERTDPPMEGRYDFTLSANSAELRYREEDLDTSYAHRLS